MIVTLFALLGFSALSGAQAMDAAVAHSPDVVAAQARLAQSAAQLAAARAAIVPSLASNYAQTPQGNPPGPNIISRLVTVGLQTNVSDFLAYGPAVRQNVLALEAARDDAAVAERDERIKTLGLYYDALRARAIAGARDKALALAGAQRDAAQKRFAAGDAPKLDVVRADVAVARARADDETARAADENATDALAVETGVDPSVLQATGDSPSPVAVTNGDPGTAARRAIAARAEVASALAALHSAEASRSAVRAAAFPAIGITGGYTAGTDSGVPVGAPSLALNLTLPLGATSHDKVAVEDGKVAEAATKVESAKRSVYLEVSAGVRSAAALERALIASTQARQEAEAEVAATELGYRNGASSSLEVQSARATFAQALIDELSAAYDVAKAEGSLALEIGR